MILECTTESTVILSSHSIIVLLYMYVVQELHFVRNEMCIQ